MTGSRIGPTPRLAACVILARDAATLEVLLLRRSEHSAFAPNAYVFPGGAQDREDCASLERTAARELYEEAGLRVKTSDLVRFSHWITPPGQSRRFDTTFFVAAAARDGAIAAADERETHDARWIAPAQALRDCAEGHMHVVFPTQKHLERLAAFTTVGELLAFARTKRIVTVAPDASPEAGYAMPPELEGTW